MAMPSNHLLIEAGSPDEIGDTDSTETTAAVQEKPADTIIPEAAEADYAAEEQTESSTEPKDEPSQPSETPTVHAAMFGAAAQKVSQRGPILDDEPEGDLIGSATSAAQDAYSNAVSLASDKYSSAMSIVSAQVYGTPKRFTINCLLPCLRHTTTRSRPPATS